MTSSEDILRLIIIYDTGSASLTAECVVTRAVFDEVKDQMDDVSREWVGFTGKLNDIDGNTADHKIRRENIAAVNGITVNGLN